MSRSRRKGFALGALLAVVGPGLLAGLSDDDPAGITTYSVLGADYGYQLLWVLLLSTVALVVFHGLAARMGVVTGQGLIGLVRQRYGVRPRCRACRAGPGQRGHDLRGVRRHRRRLRPIRHQSLCLRSRVSGDVSPLVLRAAFITLNISSCGCRRSFRVHRGGVSHIPTGGAAARPVRPDHARHRRVLIVTATVGTPSPRGGSPSFSPTRSTGSHRRPPL